MLHQLEHSVELLVASVHRAFVRFGLGMPAHMLLQIAARSKPFITMFALERTVASVRSLVHHQVRLITEPLATYLPCFTFQTVVLLYILFSRYSMITIARMMMQRICFSRCIFF